MAYKYVPPASSYLSTDKNNFKPIFSLTFFSPLLQQPILAMVCTLNWWTISFSLNLPYILFWPESELHVIHILDIIMSLLYPNLCINTLGFLFIFVHAYILSIYLGTNNKPTVGFVLRTYSKYVMN